MFINGTCQMSEILFSANLAVDGIIDQQVERFSCMQTQKEKNPFWEVDLGKKYDISQIRIYNMNSMRSKYLYNRTQMYEINILTCRFYTCK